MINKRPLRPDRLRQIPTSFSWVDHRLVRQNYLQRCDCPALALYLLLVTVGDVQGLSYYSDRSICHRLKLDLAQLAAARALLQKADLVVHQKPLYQVLSLESGLEPTPDAGARHQQSLSVAQILRRALEPGGEA
jgi:hypothetical protein